MTGSEVIVIGRVVEGEPSLVSHAVLMGKRPASLHADDRGVRTKNEDGGLGTGEPNREEEGKGEEEESMESIARRKARKTLEQAMSESTQEDETERMRRRDDEERRRRQAECWRTLPHLSRDQERFRLQEDHRDIILQINPDQEDSFLPDHTDVWAWGKLQVMIASQVD